MIKKVNISDLCPNMYIHDLNCAWLDHPFLRNRFLIESRQDIEKLRAYGIREVYIDTALGLDVPDAPVAEEVHRELEAKLRLIGSHQRRAVPILVSVQEELVQARRIAKEANSIVSATLQDCRLGKRVEVEKLEPLVTSVTNSILRNPDALVSLLRIKQADRYTFQHSVAVGTLLISFCNAQEMDRTLIEQAGLGGFLHDIGKMQVPEHILNKPGRLNENEYQLMQKHVDYGCQFLKDTQNISPIALAVVAEHHEQYDGSGYPRRLKGNEITRYGHMASIVDVYDALTSNRIYHIGSEPTEVLKKLLEWSDHHFNMPLVHNFIRTIGIYPIGTLVKLESGYLAVVVEQHHEDLLHPKVRAVFNSRSHSRISPRDFDLAKPGSNDRILSFEIPARWHIDPNYYL